ncbi:RNA polymerase sigma factor [Cyclobacterium qasimii]|uniref:Putative ECF-type RNA polymerase sigma factor n=1 Tax=Cyclobacterium qasimii M12-11B TaxID=641524 RepID=S7WMZ3_9BACT|nr:sigma-70 family RNA polymerase sigma factor [Cyclobacterium qasimii]EPR65568.1 putative ECF-type RNA polymerase sigma factor [Cyclobacterium qasimii M12-11B]
MTGFNENNRSNNKTEEEEYWVRIMAGDKSALEGLFSLFAYELMAFGLSIKPDRDLVKDCIQDLFIDIWKYRDNKREVNHVKMYIFRSLSNKVRKEINRTIKRKQEEQLIGFDALYTQGHDDQVDEEFFIEEKTALG